MKLLNIIVALALTAPAALAQQPGTPGTPGTLTLRGVVVTANDTPLPRVRVAPPVATADGSFAFANVGPGVYAVQATGDADSKGLDARTSAGQFAASSVIVTANDPPRLEGRLRYEGVPAEPPPLFNLAPLPIDRNLAPPLGDGWNSVSLQPGDTFEFQGVFGPTLLRELLHETDWYLKSVVIRGQEQSMCLRREPSLSGVCRPATTGSQRSNAGAVRSNRRPILICSRLSRCVLFRLRSAKGNRRI